MNQDNQKLKSMIDPPEGWKYGFPREFNPMAGEPVSDWFVRMGYPQHMVEFAMKYSRMWQE